MGLDGAAFDAQRLAMHERIRNFPTGGIEDPGQGWAGDTHPAGGRLLVQLFEIGQPQGLELIEGQHDFVKCPQGDTSRLEDRCDR